jgi:hypothetical protein
VNYMEGIGPEFPNLRYRKFNFHFNCDLYSFGFVHEFNLK